MAKAHGCITHAFALCHGKVRLFHQGFMWYTIISMQKTLSPRLHRLFFCSQPSAVAL